MLDIEEVGGDKAYDANYISRYAKEHGIDAQIKVRRGPIPSYCHHGKKYRKAHMIDARLDPEGFAAKVNRRNHAETGNHAFKAVLGDQIYRKNAQVQLGEILCMCIAYSLTRLVLLEAERNIDIDFRPGIEALQCKPWSSMEPRRDRVWAARHPWGRKMQSGSPSRQRTTFTHPLVALTLNPSISGQDGEFRVRPGGDLTQTLETTDHAHRRHLGIHMLKRFRQFSGYYG